MKFKKQLDNTEAINLSIAHNQTIDEIVSIEECRQYVAKFNLSDKKIYEIRNILIGIANKTINSYLENFR
jgi:hypothetical protein